ncbi:MAG TPA: HAD family hydrolase [Gemmatimonadales bacterium]|nr:HAD family hydrolase [Gemmatimonadales bacterium]
MILFDLDGVLVDSRPLIEEIWRRWALPRGLDAASFIAVAHGRRTSETLRQVAPDLDISSETAALDAMEEIATEGLTPLPGALDLLSALEPGSWAIVTSGSRAVATLRLRTAGLPIPEVMVTGDEVRFGKPHPEPYLKGAERTRVPPRDCIVVEDAPAGVLAGKAAGMHVVAVTTTHPRELLFAADRVVASLAEVKAYVL